MSVICVFGGSITYGAWDKEKGGWVNRLRLFCDSSDQYYEVYNLGIASGDTTEKVLKRFDIEAKARQPEIIIFYIGTNDAIYSKNEGIYPITLKKFEENIKYLIKKARKHGKKIVFLGLGLVDENKTMPVEWDRTAYYTNANLHLYDQSLKRISAQEKVYYLETANLLQNKDLEDGIHPNAKGHEKIFLAAKEFLLKEKII
jgi:lysophospholipase L1-like esterase